MKLDIPYYIRQVLREQREVHVPGIGTFNLEQSPAQFDDEKTNLSPPSLDITFNDSESEDNALLRYILDTGQLTEPKANKKIESFTESVFNKLLNVDAFVIDGIGVLFKREGKEEVEFDPNLSGLTREYNDMKSLNLTPIARIAEMTPDPLGNTASPKVEESGWFWPRILILSLLLIGLWFLGKYLYDNYSSQPDKEKVEAIIEEPEETKTDLAEASDRELEQKYEEIDELIDPLNEKKDTKEKTDVVVKEKVPIVADQNEDEKPQVEEPEEDNEDAVIDTPTNVGIPSIDPNVKGNEEPASTNKHIDIIPESGECIIIVGSFIKSLNAIKMVSLLERKGYKVYQSEYKGFSRVGLKYECMDEDLEIYLQNIRKKISKKAWYLDPPLKVPYQK